MDEGVCIETPPVFSVSSPDESTDEPSDVYWDEKKDEMKGLGYQSNLLTNLFQINHEYIETFITQFSQYCSSSTFCPFFLLKILHHFAYVRPKSWDFIPPLFSCIIGKFENYKEEIYNSLMQLGLSQNFNYSHSQFKFIPLKFDETTIENALMNDNIEALQQYMNSPYHSTFIQNTSNRILQFLFQNHIQITFIEFCCFFGSQKCFQYLYQNFREITPLTFEYAAAGGNEKIFTFLLGNDNFPKDVNLLNRISIKMHQNKITKILNQKFHCDPPSLDLCISSFRYDLIFPKFTEISTKLVSIQQQELEYALLNAAYIGDFVLFPLILSLCSSNLDKSWYKKLLDTACQNGNVEIVHCLISQNKINISGKNNLFFQVCENGFFRLFEYFIKSGCFPCDIRNCYRQTALHIAALYGHLTIVKFLVTNHIDIKATDTNNKTALDLARDHGNLQIVSYFVNLDENEN